MKPVAQQPPTAGRHPPDSRLAAGLRVGMEGLVLAMTSLSPWAFGGVHPPAVLALYVCLSGVLVLWAAVLLTERRFPANPCPVAACLAGLVLLGAWQLAPLAPDTLALVSPATAALRGELLPPDPESLPGVAPDTPPPATLSLDAGATRGRMTRLLAVLALFAAVRYGLGTPAAFRRMAVACVVNGVLLSVFALAQKFSSAPGTLYWHFVSQGESYGPYVCRNHFPFYVNVCFGLGVGLLLAGLPARSRRGAAGRGWSESVAEFGRRPAVLWVTAGLAVMLAANVYSLSRGGVLALAGGVVGGGAVALAGNRRPAGGFLVLLLAAGLGLGLVLWFGADPVGRRLETLAGGELDAGRREVWTRTLPLAARFPVWGTGYGTFEFVEPLQRRPGDAGAITWDHAHNDYLEVLVEGGIAHLLLSAAAIGLVYRAGLRAFRRGGRDPNAPLALGGLIGFTTVVIHSAGDFGLHMPSVAVLTTVLAAHLTAAGDDPEADTGRSGWPVLPVAVGCALVAVILPLDGRQREQADRFRLAATRAENRTPAGERDRVIEYLAAAVELTPDNSVLRLDLASSRYNEYLARRDRATGVADASQLGVTAGALAAPEGRWAGLVNAAMPREGLTRKEVGDLDTRYLAPALRDFLTLRNTSPLLPTPHLRLAGAVGRLTRPDPAAKYLDRACRLDPSDAGFWYLAGARHLADGRDARASECWRHSLECSAAHSRPIVTSGYARWGAAGLVEKVLPPVPELLVAAAGIPPLSEHPSDRQIVLRRALDLAPPTPGQRPEDLHARAWLLHETGRVAEAVGWYERAVERAPDRVEWRYQLAVLLAERDDAAGATAHLREVLRRQPDHAAARELNDNLRRAAGRVR